MPRCRPQRAALRDSEDEHERRFGPLSIRQSAPRIDPRDAEPGAKVCGGATAPATVPEPPSYVPEPSASAAESVAAAAAGTAPAPVSAAAAAEPPASGAVEAADTTLAKI